MLVHGAGPAHCAGEHACRLCSDWHAPARADARPHALEQCTRSQHRILRTAPHQVISAAAAEVAAPIAAPPEPSDAAPPPPPPASNDAPPVNDVPIVAAADLAYPTAAPADL